MKRNFKIPSFRTISALLALILALPLPLKALSGLYMWLSPFIMLNSVISSWSFVIMNIIAFVVLIAVVLKKRWFCRNLCPVGLSCDLVSGLNKKREYNYDNVPEIGKWLAVISLTAAITGIPLFIFFDPMAIFHGFFTIFSSDSGLISALLLSGFLILLAVHIFLPGIWCKKICPLGGLQLVLNETGSYFKAKTPQKISDISDYNPGRRFFVMTGIGLLAGFSFQKFHKPRPVDWLRPPSAVTAGLFDSLCCRCGNCIRVCPTKILSFRTGTEDIFSFMTPEVSFCSGYCLEECNLCSRACPTGAIARFNSKAKNQLFMGTAEINLQNCLLLNNRECNKCNESCKYEAIEFNQGSNIFNRAPKVNVTKCVGCGACMVVCPAECIIVRPIE